MRFLFAGLACATVIVPVPGAPLCSTPAAVAGVEVRGAMQAKDTGFVWLASVIQAAAPAVDSVWPGFWPSERSFMLLRPRTEALLVSPHVPPAEYAALPAAQLPPVLLDRAYRHSSYPAELGHSGLAPRFVLNGDTLPAIAPMGSTTAGRLVFFYHEAFHGYQHRAFAFPPEPSFSTVDPAQTGEEFVAGVQEERALLAAALDAPDRDSTLAVAKRYLEQRAARLQRAPTAAPVERAVELREGTAEFVACRAAAIAVRSDDGGRPCVRRWLTQPIGDWPNAPERNARLMRWRLYGTGAGILMLLEKLGVDGWRDALMRGAFPADVLSFAVLNY